MLKLDQNELPWDWPRKFKEQVTQKVFSTPWNRYPSEELTFLESALAQKLNVPITHLLLTPATIGFIEFFYNHYIQNQYLQPSPTYFRYARLAESLGKTPLYYPLDVNGSYDLSALTKLRSVHTELPCIICSPNNPTGSFLDNEDIASVASIASSPILLDSTYIWFADKFSVSDFRQLLPQTNIFQIFSFSKAFSAAAVRIGFALIPPEVKRRYQETQNPFKLNAFSRAFLEVLLVEEWWSYAISRINKTKEARQALYLTLSKIQGIDVLFSQANFLMIKTIVPANEIVERFSSQNVIIKQLGAHSLRITVCESTDCSRIYHLFSQLQGTMGGDNKTSKQEDITLKKCPIA